MTTQIDNTTTRINAKELNKLDKAQIIELLIYADALAATKGKRPKGPGRKEQVLRILKASPTTICDLARSLSCTNKNISSQLTYLRRDGLLFGKNSAGQIYIES